MQFGERFRRVLIAEDNVQLAASLVRLVSDWGAQVASATTLSDALARACEPLDLIISDIRLPDGSGQVLFERVARFKTQPLMIAMSGRASAVEAFMLAKTGVHAFAEKPFAKADIEALIEEAWRARDLRESSARDPKEASATPGELGGFVRRHGLSDQQIEVLRLVLLGTPRKDIPRAVGVTPNTCKTIVRRLLARCGEQRLSDVARKLTA